MAKFKKIVLLIGDIIILYFSLWLTLSLRYEKIAGPTLWQKHLWPFSFLFLIWLGIFFINRLYDWSAIRSNLNFYSATATSLIWCAIIGFIFFYLTTTGITPKTVLILEIIIFGVMFLWWRKIFKRLAFNKKFLDKALLIGSSPQLGELAAEINDNPYYGLKAVAWLNTEENGDGGGQNGFFRAPLKKIKLKEFIAEHQIKTVIIDQSIHEQPDKIRELYNALNLKISIFDLPEFAEKFTGKILVNSIGQMWFLENIKENEKNWYEMVKRLMDIACSAILLVFSLPWLPLIYAAIKIDDAGSAFFMQQRTGKNGKKFMAVKFRTMYRDAEQSGPQWAQPRDPRITRVGKFLRKTRIDEIPQLINVLRGEMSLIGPRPERPEFIEKLKEKIPFYEARLLVKPGITGWAQINFPYGASEQDALEKLQYDLYYIKNRSLILDISILLKTIKTVLSGEGQ